MMKREIIMSRTRIFNSDGSVASTKDRIKSKHTYIGLVLDRSGSMSYVLEPTIQGFNEHIETIKDNARKGGETKVSLVTFGGGVTTDFLNLEPSKVRGLTKGSYKPRGNTPMYDAVGRMLDELEEYDLEAVSDTGFLVIIISDGQENASTHWDRGQVAMRINRLKNTGRWTFAYVGANQDLFEIGKSWAIPTHEWVYTNAGTGKLYGVMNVCTAQYLTSRSLGSTAQANYFNSTKTNGGEDSK
jgi:uncharacterized protein YegL